MTRELALKKIAAEISRCKLCQKDSIGLPVPGEGNPRAKVVLIGEAPGKTEAKTGRPFVGRSGKFLRQSLRAVGLDDLKDVYITSPVKYLPRRGTPTPLQVLHGRLHLEKQLAVIEPTVNVLMGRVAALALLEKNISVARLHGQVVEKDGQRYFVCYHPAAAIRFPKLQTVFKSDFKKLKKLLK